MTDDSSTTEAVEVDPPDIDDIDPWIPEPLPTDGPDPSRSAPGSRSPSSS